MNTNSETETNLEKGVTIEPQSFDIIQERISTNSETETNLEKGINIEPPSFDIIQERISTPNNLSEEILSEKIQDKVSEADTESSTKTNTSSNLRRSTRTRKPPSWLLQDDSLITRRKSRRIDNKGEGDDDKKHVSDGEPINDINKSTQNVKRKRGRRSEDNTPDEIINESNTPVPEIIIVMGEPEVQLHSEDIDKNISDELANDSNVSVPNIQKKRGRRMKNSSTQNSEKNGSENGTDESNTTVPKIRRKRGRSMKGSSQQSNDGYEIANESNGSAPEVRKKRGRPRKDSSTKSSEILDRNSSDDSMNYNESDTSEPEVRKKRGRPKKSTSKLGSVKPTTETRRAKKTKTRQSTQQSTPENTSENSPENINKGTYEDNLTSQPSIPIEQSTTRNSLNPLEDSGMSLYQAVLMLDRDLESTVSDWVETYEVDNQKALLILINFIIRSCGCPKTIEQEAIEDEDAIVEVLSELQNAFKKELVTDYPLVSKARDFKKFRRSFLEFFHRLIKQVKHSILYDGLFCETIYAWVCSMSSSAFRPFRHTAAAIALYLLSCLCEVAQEVRNELNIATRQLTSEQIKNKNSRNLRNQDRMSSLRSKTVELTEKKQQLESYFNDFFNGVFIHRYRDVEAIIRAECVKELGVWIVKYPDRFLEDKVTRYLGWQLSDKSPIARVEAIRSLSRLYINETFISGLRNFTERFKPRLIEMALREAELSVRITTISLLTQIYKAGLLEDEDRDELSHLIYSDLPKVRKSIAPFVKDLLDEDFISSKFTKVQAFLSSNDTKRKNRSASNEIVNSVRREWVTFKCLAEFLVKYRRPKEVIGDVKNNRIALAIEALWGEMETLHDWHSLAEYLSKDHSLTDNSSTAKGSQGENDPIDAIEDCYRLSEREESVLVQVFVACLKLILVDPLSRDKKKTEAQIEEIREEISRKMVHILPRLLTKYAPDAGRIAEVLQIPPLMNLQVYSELRMLKAYELLIDDVKKLFLKHTHLLVLNHAVRTFSHMEAYETFSSITETNLGDLQEIVIQTFIEECENKELLTMELISDQVHSLRVALTRLETLIGYKCMIEVVEESDDNRKDMYSCFIELTRRGLLSNYDEQQIVCSAISCIWNYLLWKANELLISKSQPPSEIPLDKINDLIIRRDQIVQTLFEVGLSISSEALLKVKTAAFSTLGNIYWLFSSDIFNPEIRQPSFSKLNLSCHPEFQERIEQFVTEEIQNFRNTISSVKLKLEEETRSRLEETALKILEDALSKKLETAQNKEQIENEIETIRERIDYIQNEDDETEKLLEYEQIITQLNETLAQEYENFREQEYEKLKKLIKNIEMFIDPEEKQQILEIIGTLARGVRGGWFQDSRVAIILCQLGTLVSDIDDLIRKLVQDFKDRVSGGEAKLFANIFISSLKKSHELYVESHVDTMNGTTSLARLCANALQLRETNDKASRKNVDCFVDFHHKGISFITSMITKFRVLDKSEEVTKSIRFFKILNTFIVGMNVNGARQIYSILQQEMNIHEISPSELDKQWEPYYLYVQKLNNILTKGGVRIGNKRSAPVDDDVENLRSPKKRKPPTNKEDARNGERNEGSDSGESFQSLTDVRTKKKS
ncbi:10174_t:CDS:10 [Funneliformis geosporum]|nr:10174_t:CDS:10 [Funneliformis geosporum]